MDIANLAEIRAYIVTTMSIITASTNTPKDDSVWRKFYSIIELCALVNDKVKQK